LAQRYRQIGHQNCKFVLVGRSHYTGEHVPEWAADIGQVDNPTTEAALKSRAAAHLAASGERPTPRRIQRMVKDVLAQREIAATLQAIEDAGGKAIYVSADVTDEAALRPGVEDAVARLGTRITGVIHGAGVLADKLIEHKTLDDFKTVYDVKVHGLENMLACVATDQLTHLILFSSVAGFYGNAGQADYAIANEVLNKIAHAVKRAHPTCRVLAIDWGPWDGGMVTPALKARFEQLGIDVIPVEQGTEILADLATSPYLSAPHPIGERKVSVGALTPQEAESTPVQVVVGGQGLRIPTAASSPSPSDAPAINAPSQRIHHIHRRLTLEANPFLQDHVIGGHAVLPVVCAAAWIANLCEQCYPGYKFFSIEHYKALKGIVFDDTLADDYVLDLTEVSNGHPPDDDQICLDALIRSPASSIRKVPDDPTRLNRLCPRHYSARVTLRRPRSPIDCPPPPQVKLEESTTAISGETLYQDKVLFHGPSFRGVQRVLEITREGLTMECMLPKVPETKQGQFPVQAFNPYMTDVQLQSLLIWAKHFYGAPGLPLRIQRAEHFRVAPFGEKIYAVLRIQSDSARSLVADVTAFDAQGSVYMRVSGAEITLSDRLNELFQRNYL
jgi:NAD(P)-dependent dehydrogenase (short-subunit alcohol dehydrogenase family)